jgi:NAD(P)-dependent dehydrogenase (short-subunit alcohol dehydrogenase family)
MRITGKVAVVTGAASGIGRALARRFVADGAKAVIAADLQEGPLRALAAECGAIPMVCDVTREADIEALVAETEAQYGPIDIFCSNAGICEIGDENVSDTDWQRNWDIHVMAHVHAARAVAERMAERGEGYLVNTASAAGLLAHIDSATYTVTKHAAVAFAEWLAIRYGDRGVRVSVLCPQAVRTPMTAGREGRVAALDGMLEPEMVADCVVQAMDAETFLILPHPDVLEYLRRKPADYDRWLGGMQRLKARFAED